jgi:hypothetical protein
MAPSGMAGNLDGSHDQKLFTPCGALARERDEDPYSTMDMHNGSVRPSPLIGLKRRLQSADRAGSSAEKMREAARVLSVRNTTLLNTVKGEGGVLGKVKRELPPDAMCVDELAECMQRLRWGEGPPAGVLDENSVVSIVIEPAEGD